MYIIIIYYKNPIIKRYFHIYININIYAKIYFAYYQRVTYFIIQIYKSQIEVLTIRTVVIIMYLPTIYYYSNWCTAGDEGFPWWCSPEMRNRQLGLFSPHWWQAQIVIKFCVRRANAVMTNVTDSSSFTVNTIVWYSLASQNATLAIKNGWYQKKKKKL